MRNAILLMTSISFIANCKPMSTASSSISVDDDTRQTSNAVLDAVTLNGSVNKTGPYPYDSDGVYDCDNYANDVSRLMFGRGYNAQPIGIMRSDATSITGSLANNFLGSRNGGHAQMLISRPYEQNANWNRYIIYEPQNGDLVTSWIGPQQARLQPTEAAVQNWQQYLSAQFPKEWQGSSGNNFIYYDNLNDPLSTQIATYPVYK